MFKWAPYPYLRIVFFFSAGILTYIYVSKAPVFILVLFLICTGLYTGLWLLARQKKSADINNLAGMAALLVIYLAGFLLTHNHTAKTYPHNLWRQPAAITYYTGIVDDYIIQKPGTVATTLAVTKIKTGAGWQLVTGRVRLTIAKEALTRPLNYGDVLLIKKAPARVKPPLNPGQFDYRQYLANQQIYHQHYIRSGQFVFMGQQPASALMAYSIQIRNYLDKQLRENIRSEREYGIATALVLGIKDYLPDDIKTTYAQTGTMHVLAVSGLHVALLFYVLNFLLNRWGGGRSYRIVSFILMISFFWLYAFITALSASVLRAVVMFSLILYAQTFRRQANIYNTLSAAAFGLLLYNPYFLLDVGFQLSFLAVYGIVYFQPRIYRWLSFDGRLPDYTWKLISTSLAAQVAVLPLSFYYFHQFPVFFLLANLVAIPLSNLALLLGFALLALSWVPVLPVGLGWCLKWALLIMNYLSNWLLALPVAVINNIQVSSAQTVLLYCLLILLTLFFSQKKLIYFACFTLLMLVYSGLQIKRVIVRQQQHLAVVYHARQAMAFGFISGRKATLLADSAFYANPKNLTYAIKPHWINLGINELDLDTLTAPGPERKYALTELPDGNKLIAWRGLNILLCQNPPRYRFDNLNLHYVLLANNVNLAPDWLLNKSKHLKVVVTTDNHNWYFRQIKTRLANANIPGYYMQEQGALVIPLNN